MTSTPELFVGAAMWAHRPWVGPCYPSSTRPGGELAQYVRWCNAVEGNATHYALPAATTVSRWAEVAPRGFRFVFKLPRSITHERRLRRAGDQVTSFCRLLEPIGDRLGPVSIQLPSGFGPDDLGALAAFSRSLPRGWHWAVEVRHPDFFGGGRAAVMLDDLCRRCGLDRVVLDSRVLFSAPPTSDAEREAWSRKPRLAVAVPEVVHAPVLRLIGRDDVDLTRTMWRPWLEPLRRWLDAGVSPFVFVHTPDNATVLQLARELHADVARLVPGLAPLPVPPRPGLPRQATLF